MKRQTVRVVTWAVCILALVVGLAALMRIDAIVTWFRMHNEFEFIGVNERKLKEYRHRKTGIVFVYIPQNMFIMGSKKIPSGLYRDEQPAHPVELDSFLIAKYEVSQAEWVSVMGEHKFAFEGEMLPADNVSWEDCKMFCERSGLMFPTEAQWECACRAGTATEYAFGETLEAEAANVYRKNVTSSAQQRTTPSKSYQANGYGVHNMHGNVDEWCLDYYHDNFYSSDAASRKNPIDQDATRFRVGRGGSWHFGARLAGSARRSRGLPVNRNKYMGFRPAYYPVP